VGGIIVSTHLKRADCLRLKWMLTKMQFAHAIGECCPICRGYISVAQACHYGAIPSASNKRSMAVCYVQGQIFSSTPPQIAPESCPPLPRIKNYYREWPRRCRRLCHSQPRGLRFRYPLHPGKGCNH